MAGCEGGGSSGAPADTYTTTFSNAFSGPVTTVSAATGLAYCFAQLGSMDMSMGCGFAGVPSHLTPPLIVPFCGLAEDIVSVVKMAAIVIINLVALMDFYLLISFEISFVCIYLFLFDSGTRWRSSYSRRLDDFRSFF